MWTAQLIAFASTSTYMDKPSKFAKDELYMLLGRESEDVALVAYVTDAEVARLLWALIRAAVICLHVFL